MKTVGGLLLLWLALAALLGAVGSPVGALESPLSPVYTPLPFRPTPHLLVVTPTPTERPTPGPELWSAEATVVAPVVLDAPMARLCPAATPAPVRVLRWSWRAE